MKTVLDNGVEVIFQFTDAKVQLGDSNLPDILSTKADQTTIDSKGQIWFTTKSNIQPTSPVEVGGLGSHNRLWQYVGEIPVGTKKLYVWEVP